MAHIAELSIFGCFGSDYSNLDAQKEDRDAAYSILPYCAAE